MFVNIGARWAGGLDLVFLLLRAGLALAK